MTTLTILAHHIYLDNLICPSIVTHLTFYLYEFPSCTLHAPYKSESQALLLLLYRVASI